MEVLETYIYKAAAHYGMDTQIICGKTQAFSKEGAEQQVINILLKYGSNDITDYVVINERLYKHHNELCSIETQCDKCIIMKET
jgi:hypothetical protein